MTSVLTSEVRAIGALSASERDRLFALYDAHYSHADAAVFARDLNDKSHVVILKAADGGIYGFSTLKLYRHGQVDVLYSGDTIIDPAFWGRNDFAQSWIALAGALKREVPLYWLLIVKGHRTYRYLNLFARRYYPHPDQPTPPEMSRLRDEIARSRFGLAYDPLTGLVCFPEPRSALRAELAGVPAKDAGRAEVRFFLERNPDYRAGDELVCLCELTPDNLTRFARAWFEAGMAGVRREPAL